MTIRLPTLYLLVVMVLSGCSTTIVPGMHMANNSATSSTALPTSTKQGGRIEQVKVKPITASLIVELEHNLNNRSLGQGNAANNYFRYRVGSKASTVLPVRDYRQYRIGPTDILTITVYDHPELTIPAGEFRSAVASGTVVGEDGNIYYPYAGVVQAAGNTVEELRDKLSKLLSRYIENVQLDIRIAGYRSQRVYITGEVEEPGIQRVTDVPLTVLEAISKSGGFTEEADRRNVILTREGKTYLINLLALYEGGDTRQNVLLRHGDVLNIPDNRLNKIFVLGEVGVPGSLVMNKGRMTLNEALVDRGGVDPETSDPAQIYIFRGGLGNPELFHLNALSPDALLLADRFPLQPRDVIYVDAAQGIRLNRVIAQISPTVNLFNSLDSLGVPPFNGKPISEAWKLK